MVPARSLLAALALAAALTIAGCAADIVLVDGSGGGSDTPEGTGLSTSDAGGATSSALFCVVGWTSDACSACSGVGSRCSGLLEACDDACHAYSECVYFSCSGERECCEACDEAHPGGAEKYSALVACVACDVCSQECGEAAPGFCPK